MANLSRANSCSAKHSGVFLLPPPKKFRQKISAEKSPPKKRRKNAEKILTEIFLGKARQS